VRSWVRAESRAHFRRRACVLVTRPSPVGLCVCARGRGRGRGGGGEVVVD